MSRSDIAMPWISFFYCLVIVSLCIPRTPISDLGLLILLTDHLSSPFNCTLQSSRTYCLSSVLPLYLRSLAIPSSRYPHGHLYLVSHLCSITYLHTDHFA